MYVHVYVCMSMHNVHSKTTDIGRMREGASCRASYYVVDVHFAGSDLENEKTTCSFHWIFLQITHHVVETNRGSSIIAFQLGRWATAVYLHSSLCQYENCGSTARSFIVLAPRLVEFVLVCTELTPCQGDDAVSCSGCI